MFGIPIVFNIEKDWISASAALIGVLLGFLLENIRNRKTARKELLRDIIRLKSSLDALLIQYLGAVEHLAADHYAIVHLRWWAAHKNISVPDPHRFFEFRNEEKISSRFEKNLDNVTEYVSKIAGIISELELILNEKKFSIVYRKIQKYNCLDYAHVFEYTPDEYLKNQYDFNMIEKIQTKVENDLYPIFSELTKIVQQYIHKHQR